MNEIEQFLAKRELYKCERLFASITKEQCEKNRTRKHNLTTDIWTVGPCQNCPGLGERIEMAQGIKQEAVKSESGKTVQPHRLCDVPGCNKFRVIGHKCTNHGKAADVPKPLPTLTKAAVDLGFVKETVVRSALEVKKEKPVVSDSELHTINLLQVVREKMEADMNEELALISAGLEKIKEPHEKMRFVFDRVYS